MNEMIQAHAFVAIEMVRAAKVIAQMSHADESIAIKALLAEAERELVKLEVLIEGKEA